MQKIADSHSKIRQKSRKYRETVAGQWNLNRFHHAQIRCESNFKHGSEEVDEFCETVDESYIIGDCQQVGLIYHAVNQAYFTAMQI